MKIIYVVQIMFIFLRISWISEKSQISLIFH